MKHDASHCTHASACDGPACQALKAIGTIFNRYLSNVQADDIRATLARKAANGETTGPAPLGYLNIQRASRDSGQRITTAALDPDRAPLLKLAFELYASAAYNLPELAHQLAARGLKTRTTARRAGRALTPYQLRGLLANPYYAGQIRHNGRLHTGRHTPLVSARLFARVQQRLHRQYPTPGRTPWRKEGTA